MAKKKTINYLDTFVFPGIPDILYPVYAITESGKTINFKAIAYPNPRSKKRFTRQNQLSKRSLQAKIFDAIVNIGYFNPLTVWTEFPILIQNSIRLPGQDGLFYYLDYYFPDLRLAVELDSELHDQQKDLIRDSYLAKLGITVWRMSNLNKPQVQRTEFPKLSAYMRTKGVMPRILFDFQKDIRDFKNKLI
jgi:hypothetical protein